MGGRAPSKREAARDARVARKSPTGRLSTGHHELQNIPHDLGQKQRIDGFLSKKAQDVWGPKAMVVVIEVREAVGVDLTGRANAVGKRERWELHRDGHMVPVVVVGSSFKQARQGVAALCRNARARAREKGSLE